MDEREKELSEVTRERAVALEYQDGSELPRVLLSGAGELARQIVEIAEKHDIPVQQDSNLVDLLSGVRAGATIPPESYELVADILSFLYYTDQQWQEEHGFLEEFLPPYRPGTPAVVSGDEFGDS